MSSQAAPRIPPPGKLYLIRNIGTNTYADMRNGLSTEGNPVVGWINDTPNDHRRWTLEIVDASANKITLNNLASGTYARAQPQNKGTALVGSANKDYFILNETVTGSGQFRIDATNQSFSLYLAQGGNDQPIVLANSDSTANQLWAFEEAT